MQLTNAFAVAAMATFASAVPHGHQQVHEVMHARAVAARDEHIAQVAIVNKCSQSIWLGEGNNAMSEVTSGSISYQPLSGVSVAYKLGWDSNASWEASNAEIEFTVTADYGSGSAGQGNMTYDLSLQKGNPFQAYGQELYLLDTSCQSIYCSANEWPCTGAYNVQADNSQSGLSLPCSLSSMTFTACTEIQDVTSTAVATPSKRAEVEDVQ